MTIDKNQLAQAKKWADWAVNQELGDDVRAAVDTIHNLPENIVDGDRLTSIIHNMDMALSGFPVAFRGKVRTWAKELKDLLPAPAPRAEIKLGGWAMHPDYGKVLICSARVEPAGEVQVMWLGEDNSDGTCATHVLAADLSPVPSAAPTEQDAPTPGTPPGGMLHHPSSDHSADPEPQAKDVPGGEPWEVSVGNGQEYVGIRSETGIWELFDREDGHHSRWGLPGDITLITRMVPEQQPRVLTTIEDYENAPEGTVAAVTRTNYLITKEIGGSWLMNDGQPWEPRDARYEVIRWGWGEDRG